MFTGIVTHKAPVETADVRVVSYALSSKHLLGFTKKLQTGASISVNGVCLTVIGFDEASVAFDVIDETLRLTNLEGLTHGAMVNLERAAAFGDEIGGHLLSGTFKPKQYSRLSSHTDDNVEMVFEFQPGVAKVRYCKRLYRGQWMQSHNRTSGEWQLQPASHPETLRLTNLEKAQPGTKFNIEFDHQTMTIVDTVERVLESRNV